MSSHAHSRLSNFGMKCSCAAAWKNRNECHLSAMCSQPGFRAEARTADSCLPALRHILYRRRPPGSAIRPWIGREYECNATSAPAPAAGEFERSPKTKCCLLCGCLNRARPGLSGDRVLSGWQHFERHPDRIESRSKQALGNSAARNVTSGQLRIQICSAKDPTGRAISRPPHKPPRAC